MTVTRVADLYGRRKVFLSGLFMLATLSMIICFSTNLVLTYVAIFSYGFCCPIAIYTVGYPYLLEFFETDKSALAGSIIMCSTTFVPIYAISMIMLFQTTFYYEISIACLAMVAFLYTLKVVPESPRFYYAKNRFDEARSALKTIAYINGVSLTNTIRFDKELVNDLPVKPLINTSSELNDNS